MLDVPSLRIVFLLVAMQVCASAFAQERRNAATADEDTPLREDEAVQMGLGHNRALQALQNQVSAQGHRADSTVLKLRNPEVRLGDLSTRYFDSEVNNRELQIGIRWKPPKLGELNQAQDEEAVVLWESKVKQWEARRDLIVSIRESYAALAMLQQRRELARQRLSLLKTSLQTIAELGNLGGRSSLDRIKAHRKQLMAQKELAGIESRCNDEAARLSSLTGSPLRFLVQWIDPPALALDTVFLKNKLLAHHPARHLANQRAQLSKTRYWAERTSLIPWPTTLDLSYHYESRQQDWGELMVGFEIPLFNWNLGPLRATAIERENASVSSHAVEDKIEESLWERLADYRRSLAEYQALHQEAKGVLDRTEDLTAKARSLQWPEDGILEMELENNELRTMVLDAAYDLKLAAIRLGGVLGLERDEELMEGEAP